GIALVSLLSGAALATAGYRWRAPAGLEIGDAGVLPAPGLTGGRSSTRIVPAQRADAGPSLSFDRADAEAIAYERAHRAHFFGDAPMRVLGALAAYVGAY